MSLEACRAGGRLPTPLPGAREVLANAGPQGGRTFDVQIGDRLIALNTPPAEDDLQETF
jgi:hypothetical protein